VGEKAGNGGGGGGEGMHIIYAAGVYYKLTIEKLIITP